MAETIQEVISELDCALLQFNWRSNFLRRFFDGNEPTKDAWEQLKEKCQQASQWLCYGRMEDSDKPRVKSILDNAEKVLIKYKKFSRQKINW